MNTIYKLIDRIIWKLVLLAVLTICGYLIYLAYVDYKIDKMPDNIRAIILRGGGWEQLAFESIELIKAHGNEEKEKRFSRNDKILAQYPLIQKINPSSIEVFSGPDRFKWVFLSFIIPGREPRPGNFGYRLLILGKNASVEEARDTYPYIYDYVQVHSNIFEVRDTPHRH